jgi:2-polyprenyl-6-methoxyphenol hydroxylase-like FAD-dependent oxidoreductase
MVEADQFVTVVGAGPTGLTLALSLSSAGVPVTIVDSAPGPERESSRATTIHAGTLEALDRLDGLGREIAKAAAWARKSRVWAGERLITTVHWDRMDTRYAAMMNLPQADLEEIVRRRLRGLDVDVQWNTRVTEAVPTTSYVVGCDGAHSSIRRAIGVELVGATYDERFLLADVKIDGDLEDDVTNIWVSTSGVLGILPLPGGKFRLNGTLSADETCSAEALPDITTRRMGTAHHRMRITDVSWAAEYRTHSRLADAYRVGNVFLAGDAAHLNSPVGGQGMNLGIGDALVLASRLADVYRGASPALLDDYERSRRPIAEEVIRTTKQGTAMLTARRRPERFIRNHVMRVAHRVPAFQHRLSTQAAFVAQGGRAAARG